MFRSVFEDTQGTRMLTEDLATNNNINNIAISFCKKYNLDSSPFNKLVNFMLLYLFIKEGNKLRRKQYVGKAKILRKI